MEKLLKYKIFETYEKTGGDPPAKKVSDKEINDKIKEIIANVLKAKQYFMLLQDTADNVYKMLENALPPNAADFLSTLMDKDDVLASVFEDILTILEEQDGITEIDELCASLKNLEQYTEGNMDNILSGKGGDIFIKNDEDEEEFEEDGDDDSKEQFIPPAPPKTITPLPASFGTGETQLKRKGAESRYIVCPDCDGTGEDQPGLECPLCNGTGKTENPNFKKKS